MISLVSAVVAVAAVLFVLIMRQGNPLGLPAPASLGRGLALASVARSGWPVPAPVLFAPVLTAPPAVIARSEPPWEETPVHKYARIAWERCERGET